MKMRTKTFYILAIIFGILYSALLVMIPFLFGAFLKVLKEGSYQNTSLSYTTLAFMISLYCLVTVILYLSFYYFSNRFVLLKKRQLERGLTAKIFGLKLQASEAISLYNNDITMICDLKYRRIFDRINSLAFICFGLIYASLISSHALLLIISFLGFAMIFQYLAADNIASYYAKYRETRVNSLTLISNFIQSKFSIKSFNAYPYAEYKTNQAVINSAIAEKKSNLVKAYTNMLIETIPIATTVITSLLFTIMIARGLITAEEVVPIIFISGYLIWEGVKLFKAKNDIASVKHIATKIDELIKTEEEQKTNIPADFNNLQIKNVSVSNILKSINLSFDMPKKYLLVGHSGSGKTTLIRLLLGELAYSGFIKCDQKVVENIANIIGVLPQKGEFIADTVAKNITLSEECNQDRLKTAMTDATISYVWKDRYIDIEKNNFSGGELRKIAFARAVYHKLPVLCLDEFTVGLDKESKKAIEAMVLAYCGMVIAVSHTADQNFAQQFDEIIVLEKGEVKYTGNYQTMPQTLKNEFFKC